MSLSLYEIANEYRASAEKLADIDLDEKTMADTLESLGGDLETKAMNTAFVIRNLEVAANQIYEASLSMQDRAGRIKKNAERVRKYLHECMASAGVKKIETPYFVLAIQNNPPKVVVDDEHLIPDRYFVTQETPSPKLDKKLLCQDLKASDVPGAHLLQEQSLRIK